MGGLGKELMETIKHLLGFILLMHIPIGGIFWAYIAWEIGSFGMFWCVCIVPVSVPVGIYMLYFGPPDWILYLFG